MIKPIKCIICNKNTKQIFEYHKFLYYKCFNCEIVSTHPYPSKQIIKNHYKKEFNQGNYKFLRSYSKQYNKVYQGFIDEIHKYFVSENDSLINKKVLDIGCFTGEFLKLMQNEKSDVYGIELQKDAVKIANQKLNEIKVIENDISENPFKNKKFDIITMFGLIEHVEDPIKLINQASRMLKKNGIIVIQTPNSGSTPAKILNKFWPPYTPVEHIHLFSKKSISKVLKKENLQIVKYKNHFKILPISYVYNMLSIFSPELKNQIDKLNFINLNKTKTSLPFYIGEMFLIAKKK